MHFTDSLNKALDQMETLLLTIGIIVVSMLLISTRILLVKDGEFRGTCSTNNPMLKNDLGECTVCGADENERCKEEDANAHL